MRRITTWLYVVIALVLVAGVVRLGMNQNTAVTPQQQQTQEEGEETETSDDFVLPTTDEFVLPSFGEEEEGDKDLASTLVAENSRYRMYIHEELATVRIVEKSSGRDWRSSPPVDSSMPSSNKDFIAAPVHVRYTQGVSPSQTYPKKEKAATAMEKFDGGVRFAFDFKEVPLEFGFTVEYRLTESGFEATILDDSIYENGRSKITSIELLPFFEAQTKTETGAVFVPDGSGALIEFKEKHPQYFDGYSEFVYGGDPAFKRRVNTFINEFFVREPNVKQSIALPVYGIYRENQGFLGIITEGEYDAKVNATLPGIRNIDMYRSSVEFVYRNDDVIFIGNSGEIPLFQGNRVAGDRTIRYVLLTGEQANYVGMAHAYRDYLMNDQQLAPVAQTEAPLHIRLFGGVLRDEVVGKTYVDMTTFKEAQAIIDEFLAKGATKLSLTIEGWSKDGVFGNQPDHFPVEKRLGGKKDLSSLADYAKQRGIELYVTANYVRAYEESDKVRPNRDSIRGLDREVRQIPNYYISTRFSDWDYVFYYLKPERVYNKHIRSELKDFASLGVSGVHLNYMGDTLYSDHDPKNLTDRSETASIWQKTLQDFKDRVGKTSVDYGFGYTLGLIDRIDGIPLYSSSFHYLDKTVPFYQLAIHGLVPYTAKPSNLRDNPQVEFLRALEYGALPSYELTYSPTSDLARTMMERIFSGQYDLWMEEAIREHQEIAAFQERVGGMAIVNHEQLPGQVFRTTYEDGSYTLVNYGDNSELVGNHMLTAQGYAIVPGGDSE